MIGSAIFQKQKHQVLYEPLTLLSSFEFAPLNMSWYERRSKQYRFCVIVESNMADSSVQNDYQGGMSSDGAVNAGRQAAQNGLGLAPQQPNESLDIYNQRVAAYMQAKQEEGKQN